MTPILIRTGILEDIEALAQIYFNTIHRINIKDYTPQQIEAWAPQESISKNVWTKKFLKTKPIVAEVSNIIVGFAEFEFDGHIDCFYVHHEWIGKGIGKALMSEIFTRAKSQNISRIFVEASITAKPFFENYKFETVSKQTVVLNGVGLTNYKMERHL